MLAERVLVAELMRRFKSISKMSRTDPKDIQNHLKTGCYTTNTNVRGETGGTMLGIFVVPSATQGIIDGSIALPKIAKGKKTMVNRTHTCIIKRHTKGRYEAASAARR